MAQPDVRQHTGICDNPAPKRRYAAWAALAICAYFAISGLVFIPYLGVQNDEALFATGIYQPIGSEHGIAIFGRKIATMLNSYLGALKTWLYLPIFSVWRPSVYSLRLPVVLVGVITLWFCFILARRLLCAMAAVAVIALLATDATFLLTTTFDWGPVALQHLLTLGGVLAAVRFHESGRLHWLALVFWCFGLAMWDKALFAWTMIGLFTAALLTAAAPMLKHLTKRNLAIAGIAFSVGSAPLIRHNLNSGLSTVHENVRFSTEGLATKLALLRTCLEATSLIGYMAPDRLPDSPAEPQSPLERVSVVFDEATREVLDRSAFGLAVLAAIALLPFAGRTRRVGLFALVCGVVTWFAMSLTKSAGTGAHHIVLIWPFPHLLVAAVFIGVLERMRRGRVLFALIVTALCFTGFVVVVHHLALLVRGGATSIWTDAIFPLSDSLKADEHTTIYALDWGFDNSLRMLHRGQLRLIPVWTAFEPKADQSSRRKALDRITGDRNAVLITHAPDRVVLRDALGNFNAAIREAGRRSTPLRQIRDRLGRPQFEILRVVDANGN